MNLNANIDTQKFKNLAINFLAPLIALGLILLLSLVVLLPAVSGMPRLQRELDDSAALETQLRDKLSNLNKLVDFKSVVDSDASVVSKVLASDAMVPELLTQVDVVAKEAGLNVNKLSYSFGEATEEEVALPYSVVNVSLGAIGSYDQINTFLTNLENSARLVNVSTFRFATESTEDTGGLFNLTIVLQSPYLHVESGAVTDEPVNVDVSDADFEAFINELKLLRVYDITVNSQFVNLQETPAEELQNSTEQQETTPAQ